MVSVATALKGGADKQLTEVAKRINVEAPEAREGSASPNLDRKPEER